MKTIKLLSALMLTLFLSCSSDDTTNDGPLTVNGEWSLTRIEGGLMGIDQQFASGTIIWDFDQEANTVEVTNNNTADVEDMLPSGIYSYSLQANTTSPELCSLNFFIDEVNFGCYNLSQNQLIINQLENDGFKMTLVR